MNIIIDNFNTIIPLLEFPSKDNFYFVQVLQRKKDHSGERVGGSNNNSRLIKAYYINSVDKLITHKEEMIRLSRLFNARVGINLNPRSFEKTAFQLLQKISNQMMNKDFYNVRKAYDSVCGNYHGEIDKRWIIDVDSQDGDRLKVCAKSKSIEKFINEEHAKITNKDYKVLAEVSTKNGYHIITNPFNLEAFNKAYPDVEVHKNNPTLLYYNYESTT